MKEKKKKERSTTKEKTVISTDEIYEQGEAKGRRS